VNHGVQDPAHWQTHPQSLHDVRKPAAQLYVVSLVAGICVCVCVWHFILSCL
jgi:hypothetical protein